MCLKQCLNSVEQKSNQELTTFCTNSIQPRADRYVNQYTLMTLDQIIKLTGYYYNMNRNKSTTKMNTLNIQTSTGIKFRQLLSWAQYLAVTP